jgi:WD40 repeat protein
MGSLKQTLIQLQRERGVSVVWPDRDSIQFVVFGSKHLAVMKGFTIPSDALVVAISPTATQIAVLRPFPPLTRGHLEIIRRDGTTVRQYLQLSGADMCWSKDGAKALLRISSLQRGGFRDQGLSILDVSSGETTSIDPQGTVTSQCWSPSGSQFVYYASGKVWRFDIPNGASHELAQGRDPTWSPDGDWIAFADHNAYYVVHPDGEGTKLLFKSNNLGGGVVWSPDSRIVAYSSQAGMTEGQTLRVGDVEVYRLRFRRLEDGSEYSIDQNISGTQFQWMMDPEFAASQK